MFIRLSFAAPSITAHCRAQTQLSEYVVKAAFLVNFARFVEWPQGAFPSQTAPLTICVLDPDPFGRALDDAIAGKSIDGHPVVARRIPDVSGATGCRVLFVGSADRRRAPTLSACLPECGVLTVGEVHGPAADQMVVNFTIQDGRVRFNINRSAADAEKLRLSSRLLELATKVTR